MADAAAASRAEFILDDEDEEGGANVELRGLA